MRARGVKKFRFSEDFANVRDGWSLIGIYDFVQEGCPFIRTVGTVKDIKEHSMLFLQL